MRNDSRLAITLRSIEPGDARQLAQLIGDPEVARTGGGMPFETEEQWLKRLAGVRPDEALLLGAFDGDALVGFGSLETHASVRRRHVASLGLVVAPSAQGRGVGARLLGALVDASEAWFGHARLQLVVHADHARAIALYERHGFVTETRRRAHMLRDGALVDALGMARIRPGLVLPPECGAPPPIPERRGRLTPILRVPRKTDAAQLARLHSDPSVLEGTWQMPLQSEAAWVARLETAPPGATIIVAENDGAILGAAGLFPIHGGPRTRHGATFGIAVHGDAQGRGVGDALAGAILAHADGWLGLRRVELDVFVDDDRARALCEHHGFVLEGRARLCALRRGTYVDSYAMSRIRG